MKKLSIVNFLLLFFDGPCFNFSVNNTTYLILVSKLLLTFYHFRNMSSESIPFSAQRIKEGPFHFPPPPPTDASLLFKSLYKLMNYLTVEWCGGDLPAHLGLAFGSESPHSPEECFDLCIAISNSTSHMKKHKLDEVFAECHVLHPFLDVSVTYPSLMIHGSLSSNIRHYHKLWVTPRGVLVDEQPALSRAISKTSVFYINIHFRYDIKPTEVKELMYYFLTRLNIGCRENLVIDMRFEHGPRYFFPRYPKTGNSDLTRSNGAVHVKVCRSCQSCRIQSTKPREITLQDYKMKVRLCTRQCHGSDSGSCVDRRFKGKLTILGPGSVPILYLSDTEFYEQFNKLIQKWPCMSDNQTHLILIFECPVSRKNIHQIMSLLHDTCFQVFNKYQTSFKTSVAQLLGKSAGSSSTTVDLVAASRNLARGISEIVELSQNDDFKNKVKELLPYDTMETLQESILNKSRQFGLQEPRIIADTDSVVLAEPSSKRRRLIPGPVQEIKEEPEISVGGFCFTTSPDEVDRDVTQNNAELDDFESLQ